MKATLWILIPLLLISCQPPLTGELHETIYVRRAGADLPLYVHGNREQEVYLLILHGAGSFGLAFRQGPFRELEQDYVMVYHDQRSQGESQGQRTTVVPLVEEMAADVAAAVATLQERYGANIRIFLLGHSWGGALGSAYLLRPEAQANLGGWINVAGAHDFPLVAAERLPLLRQIAATQIGSGLQPEAWEAILVDIDNLALLNLTEEAYYQEVLALAASGQSLLRENGNIPGGLAAGQGVQLIVANNPLTWFVNNATVQPFQTARQQDFSVTPRLAEITLPSLLIFGEYDLSVSPAVGRQYLLGLGSTDKALHILSNAGHHPFDHQPDSFRVLLEDFILTHR